MPQFRDVSNDLQLGAGITRLTIDRAAAARHGLSVDDINQVLYSAYGQRQIAETQTEQNQYQVILEIDPALRGQTDSLDWLHLRSAKTGQMVPLAEVARLEPPETGAVSINHLGMSPGVTPSSCSTTSARSCRCPTASAGASRARPRPSRTRWPPSPS